MDAKLCGHALLGGQHQFAKLAAKLNTQPINERTPIKSSIATGTPVPAVSPAANAKPSGLSFLRGKHQRRKIRDSTNQTTVCKLCNLNTSESGKLRHHGASPETAIIAGNAICKT